MAGPPASILFVELLGGIGDVVIALPAIHALARSHPRARLTLLTFAPGAELLAGDPEVHDVVVARPGPPEAQAAQLGALLETRAFDLVVSDTRYGGLAPLIERSTRGRSVTDLWRQPPPNERIDRRFLAILADEGVIEDRFCDLDPSLVLGDGERREAREWLDRALPGRHPRAVLVAEAGMAIKEWGVGRWRAVARALAGAGAGVVLPTQSDRWRAREVAASLAGVAVVPPTGLGQVAALLAVADVCVAPDTGLARIAAAVGTPVTCLFGPTVAGRFGLGPPHRDRQSPLPCPERDPLDMTRQRCWWSGRCLFDDRANCLDDIGVSEVLDDVGRLLPALGSRLRALGTHRGGRGAGPGGHGRAG